MYASSLYDVTVFEATQAPLNDVVKHDFYERN